MGQDPADHLFLAGREVNLRGRQKHVSEHGLHVGQRESGVLCHAVGRCVAQRMQGGAASRCLAGALEHAVDRVVGQRPHRTAQGPPQRLPPALRDEPLHLHLVEPQPNERVRGRRQFLQLAGALAGHRDHLPPGIDAGHRRRQQLRRAGSRRDVERDQRPVPVRGQPGEDLVELLVRDRPRDPGRHPRPVEPGPLMAERLHRVVMGMRPAAPPRPVQRERVDHRTAARLQVELVEAAQHRLAVRPHRRRVRFPARRGRRVRAAPVRAGRLARHQHPPAEIAGLDPRRPIPRHPGSPDEAEPAEKIVPVGAQCRLRPARGLQVTEELRDGRHGLAAGIDDPVRLPGVSGRLQRAGQRDRQRRQVPVHILLFGHEQGP